jgi:hypothetical protein
MIYGTAWYCKWGRRVNLTVVFAKGETARTLQGYSAAPLTASARDGRVRRLAHDPDTGLFTMQVLPGRDGTAAVQLLPVTALPKCVAARGCVSNAAIIR